MYWLVLVMIPVAASLVSVLIAVVLGGRRPAVTSSAGVLGAMLGLIVATAIWIYMPTREGTLYVSSIEYEQMFTRHLILLGVCGLLSVFVGGCVGVGLPKWLRRNIG